MRRWLGWVAVAFLMVGCGARTSVPNGPAINDTLFTPAPKLTAAPTTASALEPPTVQAPSQPAFSLSSAAFQEGDAIPPEYTCDGEDISPELSWAGAPDGAASLMLVMDDPDAGGWVHWVVFNLPAADGSLPRNIPAGPLASGALHGVNSWGDAAYGGPCPHSAEHRYVFTLYALDTDLGLEAGATGDDLLQAAAGHVLESVSLIGVYSSR
jgi:Raf kinase inhibitor-like YbhB/YbcL family protein